MAIRGYLQCMECGQAATGNPDVGLVGDVHVNIGIATTIPRAIEAGVLLSSDGAAGEPRSGSAVLTPSPVSPQ